MDYGESFGVFSMVGAREVESWEAEKLKYEKWLLSLLAKVSKNLQLRSAHVQGILTGSGTTDFIKLSIQWLSFPEYVVRSISASERCRHSCSRGCQSEHRH